MKNVVIRPVEKFGKTFCTSIAENQKKYFSECGDPKCVSPVWPNRLSSHKSDPGHYHHQHQVNTRPPIPNKLLPL